METVKSTGARLHSTDRDPLLPDLILDCPHIIIKSRRNIVGSNGSAETESLDPSRGSPVLLIDEVELRAKNRMGR